MPKNIGMNSSHNNPKKNNFFLYTSRSPEVQEIIGTVPSWIVRWGITAVGLVVVLLLILSNYIKYPQKESFITTIYTSNPPQILSSKFGGQILTLLKDGTEVKAGNEIVVLQSSENYDDIIELERILAAIKNRPESSSVSLPDNLQIGEMRVLYDDLKNFFKLPFKGNRRLPFIINPKKQLIIRELNNLVSDWKNKHIMYASINGKVSWLRPLNNNSYLVPNEPCIAILPPNYEIPIVTGKIRKLENIKIGQKVSISLMPYSSEYGLLRGHISSISKINVAGEYVVAVDLPKGFLTTTKYDIRNDREIKGVADVIINERSILAQILDKILGR